MTALAFGVKAFIDSSVVCEELLAICHRYFEIIRQKCDWGTLISVAWSKREVEIIEGCLGADGFMISLQIGVLFPSDIVIDDSGFSTLSMEKLSLVDNLPKMEEVTYSKIFWPFEVW